VKEAHQRINRVSPSHDLISLPYHVNKPHLSVPMTLFRAPMHECVTVHDVSLSQQEAAVSCAAKAAILKSCRPQLPSSCLPSGLSCFSRAYVLGVLLWISLLRAFRGRGRSTRRKERITWVQRPIRRGECDRSTSGSNKQPPRERRETPWYKRCKRKDRLQYKRRFSS
jgi:hypothetical protein